MYEKCGEPDVSRHRLTGTKTVVATPVFFSQSTCGTNSAPRPSESTNAEPRECGGLENDSNAAASCGPVESGYLQTLAIDE